MNNVILDIDALRKQNNTKVKLFGEEKELARLSMEDFVGLGEMDIIVDTIPTLPPKERLKMIKKMREVVQKLLPDLTEEELVQVGWDDYLWIRESVDDRMMRDRGLSEDEIKQAKKSRRKRLLGL